MRHRSTFPKALWGWRVLTALFLFVGISAARAQVIPFDTIDWLMDRGNATLTGPNNNGNPWRPGYNNFLDLNNNFPGYAVRRWVWPFTRDLTGGLNGVPTTSTIDNPNAADPRQPRTQPQNVGAVTSFIDIAGNPWIIPPPTQRAPGSGYSLTLDPTVDYNFDYFYAFAIHNDFIVQRANGTPTPATASELEALPNTSPRVYRAVHEALINVAQPRALWTAGNLAAGRYSVQIHTPGAGTQLFSAADNNFVAHPNVTRAFVRVSWEDTLAAGVPNPAGINNAKTSRIFMVDLNQAGWITLQGGGLGPASFPFDGAANNQITVTIYTLTPDATTSTDPTAPFRAPLVTADAVRFIPQSLTGSPALGPIVGSGRILGATVATNKIAAIPAQQPLIYLAREESVPEADVADPILRSYEDPIDFNSAAAPDPTALTTAPVFYCIDNRNGNTIINGNREIFSIEKVRWRFVGASDGNTGTASASPLLGNVRCSDGQVRPMVFFATTNADSSRGRVYALEPVGDVPNQTTTAYWVYPSIRPLTAAEAATNNFPAEYHDPNYKGYNPGDDTVYPKPTFGNEQGVLVGNAASRYYDGEIVTHPTNQNQFIVRTDTRISFGGVQASPLMLDDPDNAGGPQLLLVPNMNGRVFALDAGGRGDFSATMPGTTQRIWAWPHFGADAYYSQNRMGTNTIEDEPSKVAFPTTPAFDPSAGTGSPVVLGAADGHMYGIAPGHDDFKSIINNTRADYTERRLWLYPEADKSLGAAPSIATFFQQSNSAEKRLFFTAGGRVYALNTDPPVAPTGVTVNNLEWVFPFTPTVPNPDPNDPTTIALDPGFNGSAPLVLPSSVTGREDILYALQGNGTLIALDAFPGTAPKPTFIAAGQSLNGGSTRCSPMATLINPQTDVDSAFGPLPAIVYADDDGGIHALGAVPRTDAFGDFLPLLWFYYDSGSSRSAAPILASGIILQGDEGGQLRAYGIGGGINGQDETVGQGELPVSRGGGAGDLSIDLRVLDFYRKIDYDLFALAVNDSDIDKALTPGKDQNGNNFGNSRDPIAGNLGVGTDVAAEWGEFLYVSAWGVYHALPTDDTLLVHGDAPPTIEVTFTIQSGRGSRQYKVQAPLVTNNPNDPANEYWPDDAALTAGEKATLSISGTDPNDPMNPDTPRPLQGPNENVYPWVAKFRIPIDPGQDITFSPGSPFTVTARAELRQALSGANAGGLTTVRSNLLRAGQDDWLGMQTVTGTSPNDRNRVGNPRRTFVLHPFALTVRGINDQNLIDMTGQNEANVIGMGGNIATVTDRTELLANGNRRFDPANGTTFIKSIYAPLGMFQDGTTGEYGVLNGNALEPAIFLADRSSLYANLGKTLKVQAVTRPLRWFGDWTSVMNPMPWEQLPLNGSGTPDYPNIGPENIRLTTSSGLDLVETAISLTPPLVTGLTRQTALGLRMQVSVPKYQPANINFGAVPASLPAIPRSFGANYQDIAGNLRSGIIGPLLLGNGSAVGAAHPLAYPAGGYISEVVVRADPPGAPNRRYDPTLIFNDLRLATAAGVSTVSEAYRAFELGMTVPPSTRMRVAEQTLDIGKQPHGAGYSYYDNPGGYRIPYAPNGTLRYPAGGSPWDSFFLPFTLYNESNINLFDPRIAKLTGEVGSAVNAQSLAIAPTGGVAFAERMLSDQVNGQTTPPIYATPFNFNIGGVGNIGIVSSLDHQSRNSGSLNELPLWPIQNPYVTADDVARLGLNNQANVTFQDPPQPWAVWQAGFQPHPTIIKPRPGDAQGPFMTIPSAPYGSAEANDPDRRPKLSVAIPPGTPIGTYSTRILPYEDSMPFQWREWLRVTGQAPQSFLTHRADGDAILNTDPNRSSVLETFANPGLTLKVTVREARLTEGITPGTLSQIDEVNTRIRTTSDPFGANLLPAADLIPNVANPQQQGIYLYWTSQRLRDNSLPMASAPWSILGTALPVRGGSNSNTPVDINFAVRTGDAFFDRWWTAPQFVVGNNPAALATLFPSTPAASTAYLPGTPIPGTERHASPAIARINNPGNLLDPAAYLVWMGAVDKNRGGATGQTQETDSRTFYQQLVAGSPSGPIFSFRNDPALTKLSPKPLYIFSGGQRLLYIFWHAGNRSQTALYYNASGTPTDQNTWSPDKKLPTPGALSWQSDPQPVFRQVRFNRQDVNAIDVVYTGVLKNRQTVELLLSRYQIGNDNSLTLMDLPPKEQETLTRIGATDKYVARDAGWVVRTQDSDTRWIRIDLIRRDGTRVPLNLRQDGTVQLGRFDEASGLVYFDSALGGTIAVDTRSGTVSFPNVPPHSTDRVVATYTPQVMRLNTSRDDSNILRTLTDNFASTQIGNFRSDDPAFAPRPALISSGNNTNPVALMDNGVANANRTNVLNPRVALTAPKVIFFHDAANPNEQPSTYAPRLSRMWVLYRKSDASGPVRSGIFYKAMRLMVHLPRPVALTLPDANGRQQVVNLVVNGNIGPVEVDWARGRLYFTEVDEGNQITVNYTFSTPNGTGQSGLLNYRIAWGDELVSTAQPVDASQPFRDFTTLEALMPTDTVVNEGQVAAFKDPFLDKLWVFWTSNRAGTTDLYYQTLAPLLYPQVSNQQ